MKKEIKKYAVITGASSGIGYETAKAFAARGHNVIITARRFNNLKYLKTEIQKDFPKVDVIIKVADLSVTDNVYRLYDELKEYSLRVWINNAGFGNYASVKEQNLKKLKQCLI